MYMWVEHQVVAVLVHARAVSVEQLFEHLGREARAREAQECA
jgi:hypothetical protein